MGDSPHAWQETVLISLTPQADGSGSSTDYEFAARTKDISIGTGNKPVEGVPINNGGRVYKTSPEEDAEWTFSECYFIGLETTTTDYSVAQFFENPSNIDTSDPRSVTDSRQRQKFRVSLTWTDDTSATSGAGATTAGDESYRIAVADAYITGFTEEWGDGILTAEFTVKIPPFDISGTANRKRDHVGDGAASGLSALGDYNEDQKWA